MRIRALATYDLDWVKRVHEKHFKEEFDLPNFLKSYHCVYAIENEHSEVIVVGGVRPIAELVAVTDMEASSRDRVLALRKLVEGGMFTCGVHHYDQLHCFVQGEAWIRQVQSVHFRPTVGQSMVLDV